MQIIENSTYYYVVIVGSGAGGGMATKILADAGPFVSQADKNPTWTIMALAWRTSDFIIQELKKQNI